MGIAGSITDLPCRLIKKIYDFSGSTVGFRTDYKKFNGKRMEVIYI